MREGSIPRDRRPHITFACATISAKRPRKARPPHRFLRGNEPYKRGHAMIRRDFLKFAALAGAGTTILAIDTSPVFAHHGWAWASDEKFEITGTITAVKLGNPHGELSLDAKGEKWLAEIGQPWRNERAGLTKALLAIGTEVTIL